MQTAELSKLGIPQEIVDIWRKNFGDVLLPAQVAAIEQGRLLDDDGNVVVVAPTCSGKTAIAELAAVRAAIAGKLAFYIVPHRSLCDEKYRELEARYGPVGLRVVAASSDRREHDNAIAERRFDIAVVVAEKLKSLLLRHPDLVAHIGLVAVDELQTLGSGSRGAALELLLAMLLEAPTRPRIVGLSAVLGGPGDVADWLRARLVVDTHRPVKLFQGVWCRGTYRGRDKRSGERIVVRSADHSRCVPDELLARVAKDFIAAGNQAVIFVPDRRRTVAVAQMLASLLEETTDCNEAIAALGASDTPSHRWLKTALSHGVAFHNADLRWREREIVEGEFRKGNVRVIVATTTLAAGMNLPADVAIIDPHRWRPSTRFDRWILDRLGRAEFENMAGRAGRLCARASPGHAIVCTTSPFDAQLLERRLIDADFEPVVPRLMSSPLQDAILDLTAAGHRTREEIERVLLASYSGRAHWRCRPDELRRAVDAALAACRRGGLLAQHGRHRHRLTPLGAACTFSGIRFATALALAEWARSASAASVSAMELLLVAHLSPGGSDIHVALMRGELQTAAGRDELSRRAAAARASHRPAIAALLGAPRRLSTAETRAVKKVLVLLDLLDGVTPDEIEKRYGVWAGALQRIAEDTAWLLNGLTDIGGAVGWSEDDVATIRRLGWRLRSVFIDASAPDTDRAPKTLPSARSPRSARPSRLVPPVVEEAPATLVVDLRKPEVRYRGHVVPTLPPKNLQQLPLFALAALASRPGQTFSMAELRDEMNRLAGTRITRVAPMGPDIRYKILRAMRIALEGKVERAEIDALIETVPRRGLRLKPGVSARVLPVTEEEPRSAA